MSINTPAWVKHAVFYQIFPDRFARSERIEHPPGTTFKPWGTDPAENGFQGGDLLGVVDKLDYLQELGITALYLNPIFASAAYHRYHTFDYRQVDPLLGGDAALRELLDEAHARDMRVVLDGVFNHASRGFWPFHHILENGSDSPYLDWFIIYDWPLRPYSSDEKHPPNYAAWWDLPMLPKLNTDNPAVRDYIFETARYWLEFGIDGWRLDVPAEIDDDAFWQEFRQVVKTANPEAYICGEVWHEAQRWLQGDQFDAVMNYLFLNAALSFFGAETLNPDYKPHNLVLEPLDAPGFAEQIDEMHGLYDWAINQVQLNLIDSHDTARALWIVGEDQSALRLSALFQMTMPGAPCLYYGDEIGLSAAGDPHCRQTFPWQAGDQQDAELREFYRQAIALRHRHPALRTGDFWPLHAEAGVYAFRRRLEEEQIIVIFNAATESRRPMIQLPEIEEATFQQIWPPHKDNTYRVEGGEVRPSLPPRQALGLTIRPKSG